MKKRLSVILAMVMILSLAAGCGSSGGGSKAPEAVSLRYTHANTETYPYQLAGVSLAEYASEQTGGAFKIDLFPMGQLGGERDVTESLQAGTIDLQASSLGVTAQFVPEMAIFNLPFLFKGPEHFIKVMESKAGQDFLKLVQEKAETVDLKILSISGASFRIPMNSLRSVEKPEDFKGIRIRTMEVPMHMDSYNQMGASSIPIPFGELYTALQTGTVDGNENGPAALVANKFYEVQQYVTVLPIFSNGGVLVMSKKSFDGLSAENQKIVIDGAEIWADRMNEECIKQDAEAIVFLKENNITVTELDDYSAFIEAVSPIYDKYTPTFSPEIQAIIEEIRKID